jgi:hypothetical protein
MKYNSEEIHCCFCKTIYKSGKKECACDSVKSFIQQNALDFLKGYPAFMNGKGYPEVYPINFADKFVMSKCLNKDDSTFAKFVNGLAYFGITDLTAFFADKNNYEFLFHGTQLPAAQGILENNYAVAMRGNTAGQARGKGEYFTTDFFKTAMFYSQQPSNAYTFPNPANAGLSNIILNLVLSPTSPLLQKSPKYGEYFNTRNLGTRICDQSKIYRICNPTQSFDREPYIVVENFPDRMFVLPIFVYPLNEVKTDFDNLQCVKTIPVIASAPVPIPTPFAAIAQIPATQKTGRSIVGHNSLSTQELYRAIQQNGLEYNFHSAWYDFAPQYIADILAKISTGLNVITINILVQPGGVQSAQPVNQAYTLDFENLVQTNNTTGTRVALRLHI